MFVTFPLLVWLLDGTAATGWRGVTARIRAGWWFGFGYFLAGLYWIGFAFLVDAETFGWLLPFAVTLRCRPVWRCSPASALRPRAPLWTPGAVPHLDARRDACRRRNGCAGHVLTGFPWNVFGYALDRAAGAGAECRVVRYLGSDFRGRRGVRQPRRAGGRRAVTRASAGCRQCSRD